MTVKPLWHTALVLLFALAIGCGGEGGENNQPSSPSWEQAFDASESGWLLSVAGQSPTDVYAVGGTPEEGQIWHFDGSSWTREELSVDVPLLNWVHVFDDGEVVVAGNDGTILRRGQDGWLVEETTTEQDLWGVWGASSDDIWAVGGNGREGDEATILRWPGEEAGQGDGSWQEQTIPQLERPNVRALFKVWGTGPDNVYIVGQRGVVLRWNGSDLEELHVGTSEDLISVWGTSSDNIVAVGGRGNGVVAHFDGAEWTTQSLAPTPGINGVWMGEADTAWVAGNSGTLGRLDLSTFELETDNADTRLDLHAVFGVGDARFSVGGNFGMPQGPYQGVALSAGSGQ